MLDPASAPGTGKPEPGGMTTAELLLAARDVARKTGVVREIPAGIAMRGSGRPRPSSDVKMAEKEVH